MPLVCLCPGGQGTERPTTIRRPSSLWPLGGIEALIEELLRSDRKVGWAQRPLPPRLPGMLVLVVRHIPQAALPINSGQAGHRERARYQTDKRPNAPAWQPVDRRSHGRAEPPPPASASPEVTQAEAPAEANERGGAPTYALRPQRSCRPRSARSTAVENSRGAKTPGISSPVAGKKARRTAVRSTMLNTTKQ